MLGCGSIIQEASFLLICVMQLCPCNEIILLPIGKQMKKLKEYEDMVANIIANQSQEWSIQINFYQQMKKHQSSLGSSISHHYFAVHPLSLLFLKDYPAAFTLYYQKNLQIIAKHAAASSGTFRAFPLGQTIQHFRMISDKNLDYQWSLYKHSLKTPSQTEQFIQSQHISLKDQWASYLQSREGVAEAEVEFRTIKCKLKYLIIIGKSNQDLMEKASHYLMAKSQAQPQKTPPFMVQEAFETAEKNPQLQKEEKIDIKLEQEQPYKALPESVQQQYAGTLNIPLPMALPESPIKPKPDVDEKEYKDTLVAEEVELKLSQSEMEICEQIEKEVNQYEQQVSQSVKNPMIHPMIKPERLSVSAKDIAITHSQLLNSRQEEVLTISCKSTKVIVAAVILLLLVALYAFSSGPTVVEPPVKAVKQKKDKEVKVKQQKQGKKKGKK